MTDDSLAGRLRRLRGAQPAPAALPASAAPTLAERLRRLRPGGAAGGAPRVTPAGDGAALADALGARMIAPGVLLLERRRPLHRPHGRLCPAAALPTLPELLPAGGPAPPEPARWLFLDTETSGLAGGTGTWAFVCGFAVIDGADLLCRQYLLTRLDAEPALMAAVHEELTAAGLWVSFNGKTFDLPLLAARLRLTGTPAPAPERPHLDLLHPLRRAFGRRWQDCRLGRAERELLGFVRTADLPGADAPAAWLDWLRQGKADRLAAVLRHNRFDLISLAALIPALAAVQRAPADHGADPLAIARHLLRQGHRDAAHHLLATAATASDPPARLALAELHRRNRDWPAALALWQPLAAQGEPAALLALAKYHEHIAGDHAAALACAQRLPDGPAPAHRRARLQAALATPRPARLPLGEGCADARVGVNREDRQREQANQQGTPPAAQSCIFPGRTAHDGSGSETVQTDEDRAC